MLPPPITSRPLLDAAPTIELVLGYSRSNNSSLLATMLGNAEELKFRVKARV